MVVLIAAVPVSTGVAPPAAAGERPQSLPFVTAGARPGPDVLYAPPPPAPQLQNRDPRFDAAPLLVSGNEAYVDGEYLYQDFLHDDCGSDTDGVGQDSRSECAGNAVHPADSGRYGGNAADLVEFRIAAERTRVTYRITLNTLLERDSTIAAIAFDTDGDESTGASTLPRDPGAPFPGTDEVITTWGTGAEHVSFTEDGAARTTPLRVRTDLQANQLTITVPRTVSDPRGTWRATVATGLYDAATGGWLRPQNAADRDSAGGAGPLDPQPPGIFNLAFRFDEPVLRKNVPPDSAQSAALADHAPTRFAHAIDFDALRPGVRRSSVPDHGTTMRIFPSRLALGEGRDPEGRFPQYKGRLQPYSLYVPTEYERGRPTGLTLALHSLGQRQWQYNGTVGIQQIGEARDNLVATPLGRGPDGWYRNEAEYDVFEMWNDLARHFTLDPDRVAISGYSMGGYGTYRLGMLYPDLFGKAFSVVAPPGEGVWVPPAPPTGGLGTLTNLWLENARNVPYLNVVAGQDELVPLAGTRAHNLGAPEAGVRGFDQLGYRFRYVVHQAATHSTLAALGYDMPMATDFLGDARVDRDPHHVSFAYVPASDDRRLGLVHDHAYWVFGTRLAAAGADGTAAAPAKGVVDAFSHGFGLGDATGTRGSGTGTHPLPYTEVNRSWGPYPEIPVTNRLDLRLTDVASAGIALTRARLDPRRVLTVRADADSAGEVLLAGRFRDGTRVFRDGKPVAARTGPHGATLPIAAGTHTYTLVPPRR
jgi:dienelactone hydrolase